MQSMTGYSYIEENSPKLAFSLEMRSYNSRFLEVSLSLPPLLGRLESLFRSLVEAKIRRGKVEINLRVKRLEQRSAVTVNVDAAQAYAKALGELASVLDEKPQNKQEWLTFLASQSGVLTLESDLDIDAAREALKPAFDAALEDLLASRKREGERLLTDITAQLEALEAQQRFFAAFQPTMEARFREQLVQRLSELEGALPASKGFALDEARLQSEIASLLVKYTINEEIVRLGSHLQSFRALLRDSDAPGRQIDFLCQEILREINTIGSKNQAIEVGRAVLVSKNALENIREQARNVE
jgi:uncharacterized protein (TIGR00255 family)